MKKVLLSKSIEPEGMKVLKGEVQTVELTNFEPDYIKKIISDIEGIILRTNIKITKEIIGSAPLLKIISRTGAGVDNIDLAAASERGILVCNAPGINSISVAEHSLALILAMSKQLKVIDEAVRKGDWRIRYTSQTGDLEGKTLGLVGLGQIGSLLAEKARLAFHMKIIAYDPYVKKEEQITLTSSLEDLFGQSDFISIHVPHTKETHHLVNEKLLSLMKPSSYLVNTARGTVVDEKALFQALEKGLIAGAALDVFEEEPPSLDNPLLKLNNVIVTAHTAGLNRDCERKLAVQAAQAIVDYFQGKEPEFIYNKKDLSAR
jgi:D-3-phosphoglycerate dehydrogenase / 2-oxoglutarate reductase